MKIFLLSNNLSLSHVDPFQKLIGKLKVERALFISAAAVPYGLDPKPDWVAESLDKVKQFAEKVDETSLETYSYIPEDLSRYGFIFVSGGNTFYLAYRLAETGFDIKIKQYIDAGGVYSGSSAGAIILMDNIELFALADNPDAAPQKHPGLGVLDFALIPHIDNEKYGHVMKEVAKTYQEMGLEVVVLKDNQALLIDGQSKEVI
ncbi:MAG: Type 1 glutamine amidotransferase-like domain-containing protein [bacterium]|nr:Type 1 glutamine amidotransferase-like domain-containing protein [bacterium]